MEFKKSLAPYYIKWFQDCHDSVIYCRIKNDKDRAADYLNRASEYLTIIMKNWDAIEFFSIENNAFKIDSALPVEYRGYSE